MADEIKIDEFKQKYGEVKVIVVGVLTGVFRKPDIKIWRFAMKSFEKSVSEFKRAMTVNCFVEGDKELIAEPFIADVIELVDEFIQYEEATVVKEGNAYRVTIMDKSCLLRPVTIELQITAERNDPEKILFKTQQNMLELMWLEGDAEIKDQKQLDYHLPVLRVLKDLREKHLATVKNS